MGPIFFCIGVTASLFVVSVINEIPHLIRILRRPSNFLDSCNDLACQKECEKRHKMVNIMKCMSAHTDFGKSERQKKGVKEREAHGGREKD